MHQNRYTWQGWQLGVLWVLANTLGWSATGALAEITPELNATLGLVIVASAQWVVLRERVRAGGYYVLLTYIAGFVGSLLGVYAMRLLQGEQSSTVSMSWNVFLWAVDGAIVGAAQALLLRHWKLSPLAWIGASALAFALASIPSQFVRISLQNNSRLIASTFFGLVSGLVTAGLLWWVSSRE